MEVIMNKFLLSSALVLTMSSGAYAQGLSFTGGSAYLRDDAFISASTGYVYGAGVALAYDFTGNNMEFQLDGAVHGISGTQMYDVSILVANQISNNTKIGVFGEYVMAGTTKIPGYGLSVLTRTSGGSIFEGTIGNLGTAPNLAYLEARYSTGNWFAKGMTTLSTGTPPIYGALLGYKYHFNPNASLSLAGGGAKIFGSTVGMVELTLEMTFGQVNSGANVDDELFTNYRLGDFLGIL